MPDLKSNQIFVTRLRIVTKWPPTNNPTERGQGDWDFRALVYKDLPFGEHAPTHFLYRRWLEICRIVFYSLWNFVEPCWTSSYKMCQPFAKNKSRSLEKCLNTHQQKFTFRRTQFNTFCTQKRGTKMCRNVFSYSRNFVEGCSSFLCSNTCIFSWNTTFFVQMCSVPWEIL